MARLKTFYTADEITNNLYTSGSEYMTEDNVEYVGSYHSYATGERYTNQVWNSKISKRLLPYVKYDTTNEQYKQLKPNINVRYETPIGASAVVIRSDVTNGFVTRYFMQRINDAKILEVNQTTYQKWFSNTIDKKMYQAVSIQWTITGNLDDTTYRGAFQPGVMTKNKLAIADASTTIPDIANILTNLTQFYTDTDYIAPIDINGLDS
jgi:hypothetical protein